MNDEIKEITKVDKQLLDKIEHILASELNCEEYDKFYNYFNEIKKPNIIIDIKDDENIKDYITNLQQENERIKKMNMHEHKYGSDMEEKYLLEKVKNDRAVEYIKEMDTQLEVYGDYDILSDNKNELLNILNGRSDE